MTISEIQKKFDDKKKETVTSEVQLIQWYRKLRASVLADDKQKKLFNCIYEWVTEKIIELHKKNNFEINYTVESTIYGISLKGSAVMLIISGNNKLEYRMQFVGSHIGPNRRILETYDTDEIRIFAKKNEIDGTILVKALEEFHNFIMDFYMV